MYRIPYYIFAAFLFATACSLIQAKAEAGLFSRKITSENEIPWDHYAGDLSATKFSPANMINKENVKNLKVAWKWNSIDNEIVQTKKLIPLYYEGTPLMKNGTLFAVTSFNMVAAIDPASGEQKWKFDPKTYEAGYPTNLGFVERGLAYWSSKKDDDDRLFLNTNDGFLYSINPKTGLLSPDFATAGRIDLKLGLGREVKTSDYGVTSPPLVCGSTVIVGSSIVDIVSHFNTPPGDVRGFDTQTGKLKWTFKTIPQDGSYGSDTWENDSNKYMGNTNVWTFMSADPELNSVYLPTSTPTNDFYGGERKGDNLFGESIVSLDCDTGVRNWHYQVVHHGLWDYDLPTAPILMNTKANGKTVKALAQLTKQGFIFVLDRTTGIPIWPIEDKAVPASDVPGERASATQPMPTWPVPFERQGLSENDLIDFSPQIRSEVLAYLKTKNYKLGPLYTPPSLQGTILVPGNIGGASWAGGAYNPLNGMLYIPSITLPYVSKLVPTPEGTETAFVRDLFSAVPRQPNGFPLTKPPYGRITAYDMNEGAKLWMKPYGRTVNRALALHPSMANAELPNEDLGTDRRIHVLVTPELLFATQDGKSQVVGFQNGGSTLIYKLENEDPMMKAMDVNTGETIAEIKLENNAYGAPMTYVHNGKQYIVLPYGGANLPAGLVAYSIEPLTEPKDQKPTEINK